MEIFPIVKCIFCANQFVSVTTNNQIDNHHHCLFSPLHNVLQMQLGQNISLHDVDFHQKQHFDFGKLLCCKPECCSLILLMKNDHPNLSSGGILQPNQHHVRVMSNKMQKTVDPDPIVSRRSQLKHVHLRLITIQNNECVQLGELICFRHCNCQSGQHVMQIACSLLNKWAAGVALLRFKSFLQSHVQGFRSST